MSASTADAGAPHDRSPAPAAAIERDMAAEARRLIGELEARGLTVRALGGAAVKLILGERLAPAFDRELQDVDLITRKRHGSAVEQALAELGWAPERRFNALNGARRLLFSEPEGGRKVDVFIDSFEMCHRLPLAERLDVRVETIPPIDLLLTKLQIVELNAKDRGDCYALLLGCPISDRDDDPDALNLARLAELAGADWGLYHTCELNLARLREGVDGVDSAQGRELLESIARVEQVIVDAPKTRGWRMRARIGERKRWYEEPDEIG